MNYTREVLYNRHRLSHLQINKMLGEQDNQLDFEEKLFQLSMLAAFLEIVDKFKSENLWFLPLKGPMLSYRIYEDATCRRYRDFDFLIKQGALPTVLKLFREMGYVYDEIKWPENGNGRNKTLSRINQLTLYNSKRQITVEIHWRLLIDPVIKFEKIENVLEKNIQQIEFAGKQINQLTLEFELLYLIIHGGLHTWRRLKWLVDVNEIVNRFEINATKFDELVKLFNAQRMVGLCNAMLRHFFPESSQLPVDYEVPGWFFRYALKQINKETDSPDNQSTNFWKLRWFYIQAFPEWKYKQKRLSILISSVKKLRQINPRFFEI